LVRQGIDKLREYKKSVITEAVTKGLDPDVPMKDSGVTWIGEIPEAWEVRRLKKVSDTIVVGIVINPSQYISENGLPYIYGGDIHEGKIDYTTCRKISKQNSEKNIKTRLAKNDILTVRVGYPGLTAVVPPECEGGNCASVILTRRGNFNSYWYCYCMNSGIIKSQIDIVKYGAAQEQFNLAHMLEFLVPYPPLSEQRRIADYLDAKCAEIDTLIAQKQALLDKLAEYKKSFIFEYVTGKREVAA
ncbi:restriction endonuclease subunit S, partial [Desulfovibrio sp.]|uniref:restriction endonuclease subunit S n=1 Tax=Desulfovibrio sp. TaxID=885 RepID=UPI0023D18211